MGFYKTLAAGAGDDVVLCAGIDPTPQTLDLWGLEDSAAGAKQFGLRMVEAVSDHVRVVKPQIAFFERFGPAGYQALSEVIREARQMGLLVLADAKRGDIGSTMVGYAQAWIGNDAPLQVDAITAVPYLGFDALAPLFRRASDAGAYVFVVARSSNPEGTTLQDAGRPKTWHRILDGIGDWEQQHNNHTIGAVVGATVPADLEHALTRLSHAYFLAPGIGAQGASLADVSRINGERRRLIASSSRALGAAGPSVTGIQRALAAA